MPIVDIDLLKHTNILKISDAGHEISVDNNINILRITSTSYENINNTIVNNHNVLINLDDDDHLQYHNDARGDIRYYLKNEFGILALVDTVDNSVWAGTELSVINGGTGADTAAGARTNFGLGTIATQNANNVNIDGGSIDNTAIGNTNPLTGSFTDVNISGTTNVNAGTEALPAIISEANNDTGIWFPAINVVAISVGGVEKFRLGSTGLIKAPSITTIVTTATGVAMDDSAGTWIVTATGQTMTLPAASADRIGNTWIVSFAATGTLTVQRAGADTIMTPTSATDTSVILTIRGMSLEFKCTSATTWTIV
jgi:hypothetical protein